MTPVGVAWYGRALIAVGFLLTAGTGIGLYSAPRAAGESFAWEIVAPPTAAFAGAGYLGAACGLLLCLREPDWRRVRIVLVGALVLTTTNLVATLRFLDQFRLATGEPGERLVAWTWLVIYAVLPPAVAAVLVVHEWRARASGDSRRLGPGWLAAGALGLGAVGFGVWLMAAPGNVADAWPWRLPALPAAIVGTWLCTLGATAVWAAIEREWLRVRYAAVGIGLSALLHLVAAARLRDDLSGSELSVGIYVGSVAVLLGAVVTAGLAGARGAERGVVAAA